MLTQSELQQLVHYDPETGIVTRLVRTSNAVKVGDICGSIERDGGLCARIKGRLYRLHRLIWLYVTGSFPQWEIDHLNGIKTDNRWRNLRDVSHRINMENLLLANADNKTGFLGVSLGGSGYRARIRSGGKVHNIGVFATPEAAHAAYVAAKRRIHFGCML